MVDSKGVTNLRTAVPATSREKEKESAKPAVAKEEWVTVKPGDTLYDIAGRYGDPENYRAIIAANPGRVTKAKAGPYAGEMIIIQPGDKLKIPQELIEAGTHWQPKKKKSKAATAKPATPAPVAKADPTAAPQKTQETAKAEQVKEVTKPEDKVLTGVGVAKAVYAEVERDLQGLAGTKPSFMANVRGLDMQKVDLGTFTEAQRTVYLGINEKLQKLNVDLRTRGLSDPEILQVQKQIFGSPDAPNPGFEQFRAFMQAQSIADAKTLAPLTQAAVVKNWSTTPTKAGLEQVLTAYLQEAPTLDAERRQVAKSLAGTYAAPLVERADKQTAGLVGAIVEHGAEQQQYAKEVLPIALARVPETGAVEQTATVAPTSMPSDQEMERVAGAMTAQLQGLEKQIQSLGNDTSLLTYKGETLHANGPVFDVRRNLDAFIKNYGEVTAKMSEGQKAFLKHRLFGIAADYPKTLQALKELGVNDAAATQAQPTQAQPTTQVAQSAATIAPTPAQIAKTTGFVTERMNEVEQYLKELVGNNSDAFWTALKTGQELNADQKKALKALQDMRHNFESLRGEVSAEDYARILKPIKGEWPLTQTGLKLLQTGISAQHANPQTPATQAQPTSAAPVQTAQAAMTGVQKDFANFIEGMSRLQGKLQMDLGNNPQAFFEALDGNKPVDTTQQGARQSVEDMARKLRSLVQRVGNDPEGQAALKKFFETGPSTWPLAMKALEVVHLPKESGAPQAQSQVATAQSPATAQTVAPQVGGPQTEFGAALDKLGRGQISNEALSELNRVALIEMTRNPSLAPVVMYQYDQLLNRQPNLRTTQAFREGERLLKEVSGTARYQQGSTGVPPPGMTQREWELTAMMRGALPQNYPYNQYPFTYQTSPLNDFVRTAASGLELTAMLTGRWSPFYGSSYISPFGLYANMFRGGGMWSYPGYGWW